MTERGARGANRGARAPTARLLRDGVRLHQLGRLEEAAACYRAVLAENENADALHLLGVIAHQRGRQREAAALIARAIARAPGVAAFHNNLGLALLAGGDAQAALASFRRAIGLDPGHAEARNSLGNALMALGQIDEAIAAFRAALVTRPDYPEALSNLGSALHKRNQLAEAEAALRRAIQLRPNYAPALANLAVVLRDQGDLEGGLAAAEEAVAADGTFAQARVNRAVLRLQLGQWAEGWPDYEWRWKLPGFATPRRDFACPSWDGGALAGRTLLVHAEQGLGSAIQFARFLPGVAAKGGRVLLECQAPLRRLFAWSLAGPEGPVARVLAKGDPLPPADAHAPLMSLPGLLGITLDRLPARVPYLAADAGEVAQWRQRLKDLPAPRVGLAWAGNPEHANDHNRSLPSALLAPLLATPGASFVGLQVGDAAKPPPEGPIRDVAPDLADFAATAACVEALDLVISVDTAVAHLAGALARPVWLLTTPVPEWRWLHGRDDSPWYPTLRLWRQRRLGDWPDVIARVGQALRAWRPQEGRG